MKILTNDEIIDKLHQLEGVENDNQLAEKWKMDRQRFNQFRGNNGRQLPHRIISFLFERLEAKEKS